MVFILFMIALMWFDNAQKPNVSNRLMGIECLIFHRSMVWASFQGESQYSGGFNVVL